ncbi:AraC family transcriptional regulator [Mucilaginibacter sp. BJC16-A38]|uniref:helix-turn-helix domain-containing protein n=1 Tax=Mucilaginibacter phenanthrenivorans TaxID=1234842 RepID=UPI00215875D6|nr:AraC family transcriptional regulator [Mucilaginibacter phenanthrenivorans]MCR8559047.1 AraC family transcriptional regulator [Mucilaginibacter phenanthrenivorans]
MKHYKNLSELHRQNGFPPPQNPLFSIYRNDHVCTIGDREFTSDFYMIGLKKILSGEIVYGRTKFDHECGLMLFFKPRQVIEMKNLEVDIDGFLIFIHEDYLNGHSLHNDIKKYHYFDYEINEALHLSPTEEKSIWDLYDKINAEYYNNQDEYSRELILANVDTLLKYSQRFYKRQFLNRAESSGKMVTRFNEEIDKYVASGMLGTKGFPSVHDMAARLNISAGYLTDLLKQETGKTALEHIHIYLISEAKNLLLGNDKSVSEIAYALGFESLAYFSRLFKKEVGVSPNSFKKHLYN